MKNDLIFAKSNIGIEGKRLPEDNHTNYQYDYKWPEGTRLDLQSKHRSIYMKKTNFILGGETKQDFQTVSQKNYSAKYIPSDEKRRCNNFLQRSNIKFSELKR